MKNLICPGCTNEMKKEKMPDLTIDECKKCGGIFLDKNELNILATGMAGNIEYSSTSGINTDDIYPDRNCPVCEDKKMEKVNLLEYCDIIFDYCPSCHGFYLDKNEVETMNETLKKIHKSCSSQEFRDIIDGHLVRIDVLQMVKQMIDAGTLGLTTVSNPLQYLQILVYFKKPLDINLNLHYEKWTVKLAKAFKLFNGQDIVLGNPEFDKQFIVESSDPDKVKKILNQDIQQAIVDFMKTKPTVFKKQGKIWIFDDRLVYMEGSYGDNPLITEDDINATDAIINGNITKSLIKIAGMIDATA